MAVMTYINVRHLRPMNRPIDEYTSDM